MRTGVVLFLLCAVGVHAGTVARERRVDIGGKCVDATSCYVLFLSFDAHTRVLGGWMDGWMFSVCGAVPSCTIPHHPASKVYRVQVNALMITHSYGGANCCFNICKLGSCTSPSNNAGAKCANDYGCTSSPSIPFPSSLLMLRRFRRRNLLLGRVRAGQLPYGWDVRCG